MLRVYVVGTITCSGLGLACVKCKILQIWHLHHPSLSQTDRELHSSQLIAQHSIAHHMRGKERDCSQSNHLFSLIHEFVIDEITSKTLCGISSMRKKTADRLSCSLGLRFKTEIKISSQPLPQLQLFRKINTCFKTGLISVRFIILTLSCLSVM